MRQMNVKAFLESLAHSRAGKACGVTMRHVAHQVVDTHTHSADKTTAAKQTMKRAHDVQHKIQAMCGMRTILCIPRGIRKRARACARDK